MMEDIKIEKLRQIVSRTDKTGNEKVDMLVEFAENYHKEQMLVKNNDICQNINNRALIVDEIVILKKREFINKDGDWCDADELLINGEVKYFAYKADLHGC